MRSWWWWWCMQLLLHLLNNTIGLASALLIGGSSTTTTGAIISITSERCPFTPSATLHFAKGRSSSSSVRASASIMESVVKSFDCGVESDGDSSLHIASSSSTSSHLHLLNEWKQHENVEFHYFSSREAAEIRAALLSWYHVNRRKLPWRGDAPPWDGSTAASATASAATSSSRSKNVSSKTAGRKMNTTTTTTTNEAFAITAYGVWVSEIMLQQTRVEAVIDYWVRWMQTFPTVDVLAAASEEQVNAHWAGLGFYRRARMLHQASKIVVEQHGSELPRSVVELMQLPGIGRYTASAIASIAYNVAVPVVDGNVCRVLSRLRGIANHIKDPVFKDKWAWTLAEQIINANVKTTSFSNSNGIASAITSNDNNQAGNVNQAIMELGATYCSPSGTGTDPNDPLKDYYWSTRIANQIGTAMSSAATITTPAVNDGCQVCCKEGIDQALETLQNLILEAKDGQKSDTLEETIVAPLGHKVFPLPPPKPVRREEVLAVAAISIKTITTTDSDDNDPCERWLLVKRPSSGLLAGQWEFPSACIWTSNDDKNVSNNKKKKKQEQQQQDPPHFAVTHRRKALKTLLREIMTYQNGRGDQPALLFVSSDDLTTRLRGASNIHQASPSSSASSRGGQKRNQQDTDPIVHVFSHVRHTMWIEQVQMTMDDTDSGDDEDNDDDDDGPKQQQQMTLEWTDSTGRQARWMNRKDMQQVGVTSGVKKILAAVVKARSQLITLDESKKSNTTTRATAKNQSPKKRHRRR